MKSYWNDDIYFRIYTEHLKYLYKSGNPIKQHKNTNKPSSLTTGFPCLYKPIKFYLFDWFIIIISKKPVYTNINSRYTLKSLNIILSLQIHTQRIYKKIKINLTQCYFLKHKITTTNQQQEEKIA